MSDILSAKITNDIGIDGKTGKPADKHINSVTIVTKQGKLGDALSTALFVMGVDEAINYFIGSKIKMKMMHLR